MKYGYARVSSVGQMDVQNKRLQDYYGKIFEEEVSGRTKECKQLQEMLELATKSKISIASESIGSDDNRW